MISLPRWQSSAVVSSSPRPPVRWSVRAGAGAGASDAQRKLRALNLLMLLPLMTLGGVLVVASDADTWWEVIVLGVGVLAGLVAFERWTAGDLGRVSLACMLIVAVVWALGALVTDSPGSIFGIAVVGPLVVPRLRIYRGTASLGLLVFVASAGGVRLLTSQGDVRADLISYVIVPVGITAVVLGLMFPNKRFYDVVSDLEESRDRDMELAVVRERVRFASDLHDIQGHTLHVVKLKIALAQRLLLSDTPRVRQELNEMYTLVADTISETKQLVYAQRRLNVIAELENAKNLFEAAGIRVRILHSSGEINSGNIDPGNELLGQVLRETTTNILRHAQAANVEVTLTTRSITIVNDGLPTDGQSQNETPPLRGLATLMHRVQEAGGEMTIRVDNGRFSTSASFTGSSSKHLDSAPGGAL